MQVDARISRIHIKLKSNQPFCKLPAKQHCQSSLSGCSFLSSLALPSKRACLISTFLYSLHHASMKNSLSKFIYYIYLISGKVTFAYISFPAKNYINTNRVISSRPGKQPEMFARLFGVCTCKCNKTIVIGHSTLQVAAFIEAISGAKRFYLFSPENVIVYITDAINVS